MALIDKNKDVQTVGSERPFPHARAELVDQGRHERRAVLDQLHQMLPGASLSRLEASGSEGLLDLPIEITPVSNDHNSRARGFQMERQRPRQHDHRE